MPNNTEYYKTLGITKEASEAEIKKAYRKESLRWHPDKNPGDKRAAAEARFKKIGEAYEVLSDPNKREVYDQFGEEGLKGGGGAGGPGGGAGFGGFPGGGGGGFQYHASDPNDLFNAFFGGGGGGGMEDMFGGGGGRSRSSRMGGGGMPGMGGMGGMPGMGGMGGMPGMGGGGMPGGFGGGGGGGGGQDLPPPGEIIKPLALTLEELYKGGTKRLKITRHTRTGSQEEKILEVAYKAGWKKGTKIKFASAGNEDEYGQSQTVSFVVEEKPHTRFERVDDDLHIRLNITLSQALLGPDGGGEIVKEVEQLDGRRIQVTAPTGIVQPGSETRIQGEGMPVSKASSIKRKGDLVVKWNVIFPTSLTPTAKKELRKVLN